MFILKRKKFVFDPFFKGFLFIFFIFCLIFYLSFSIFEIFSVKKNLNGKRINLSKGFFNKGYSNFKIENENSIEEENDFFLEKKINKNKVIKEEKKLINFPFLTERDLDSLYDEFFEKKEIKVFKENKKIAESFKKKDKNPKKKESKKISDDSLKSKKKIEIKEVEIKKEESKTKNKNFEKKSDKKNLNFSKKTEEKIKIEKNNVNIKGEKLKIENLKNTNLKPEKNFSNSNQKNQAEDNLKIHKNEKVAEAVNFNYGENFENIKNNENFKDEKEFFELDENEFFYEKLKEQNLENNKIEASDFLLRLKKSVFRFPGKKVNCVVEFSTFGNAIENINIKKLDGTKLSKAYEMHILSNLYRIEIPKYLLDKNLRILI